MPKLKVKSNAKLNLALDVLGVEKRKNKFFGYHEIRTVLHEITEKNCTNFTPDIVTIEVKNKSLSVSKKGQHSIAISTTAKVLPNDDSNIAYKAAAVILSCPKAAKLKVHPRKITIHIEKNIPISSGLGGGSSNAAAVIKGLNKLLNLKLGVKELQKIAAKISMDAPFFIEGKTALATNFGEKITQLPYAKNLKFKLFPESSKLKNKTASAYAALDLKKCGKNTKKTAELLRAIRTAGASKTQLAITKILPCIHNDFETLSTSHRSGQKADTHLAGSGLARFHIFSN